MLDLDEAEGTVEYGLRHSETFWFERAAIVLAALALSMNSSMLALRLNKLLERGRYKAGRRALQLCIILLVVSGAFIFSTIIHQVTNHSELSCTLSFYTCAFLYAGTKICVYLFLTEKVFIAQVGESGSRSKSSAYRFNVALLIPFSCIIALMIAFGGSGPYMKNDSMECAIWLKASASLPLAVYDTFVTSVLTYQFVRVLVAQSNRVAVSGDTKTELWLKSVAKKNVRGAATSLVSTALNLTGLAIAGSDGQHMVMCFSLCTFDVIVNAWISFRMTSRGGIFSCFADPNETSSNGAERKTIGDETNRRVSATAIQSPTAQQTQGWIQESHVGMTQVCEDPELLYPVVPN